MRVDQTVVIPIKSPSLPGASHYNSGCSPEMKVTAVFLLGSLALCQAGNGNAMERFVSETEALIETYHNRLFPCISIEWLENGGIFLIIRRDPPFLDFGAR